jgi:non-ribosomal peptide synthase protein (TIGR01720 family)
VTEVEAIRTEHAGPVPLTPAQALLLQAGGTGFERWNDAVLLDLPAGLGAEAVEAALSGLVSRHDALRLRFAPTTNGSTGTWTQQPLEPADPAALLAVERFDGPLDAVAAETLRDGVDLVRKPLLAVLSSQGAGPDRLLLAAHPMVLDGRSFHLLIGELAAACEAIWRGAPPASPHSPATPSFRSLAEPPLHASPGPSDAKGDPAARAVGAAGTLRGSLGPDDTRALLDEALRAYGNTVEEVLLAALTDAYVGWTGARDLRVEVAGTVGGGDLDGSRTIGCLGIPVPAHLERKEAPGDLLKGVKERLRHLSPLGPEPVPEVGLSWLGELDGTAGWRGERLAPRREPGALRRHLLDVEGWVSGGCLRVAWTFSDRAHRRDAVQALSERFLRNLSSLIQHCQASAGGFTPSDFPVAGLSQEDLDDLLAELS